MRLLFVDTAGWMAMADESDPLHRASVRIRDGHLEKGGLLVTSDYVMDETLENPCLPADRAGQCQTDTRSDFPSSTLPPSRSFLLPAIRR